MLRPSKTPERSPFPMRGYEAGQRPKRRRQNPVTVPHEGLGAVVVLDTCSDEQTSPFPMRGWEVSSKLE